MFSIWNHVPTTKSPTKPLQGHCVQHYKNISSHNCVEHFWSILSRNWVEHYKNFTSGNNYTFPSRIPSSTCQQKTISQFSGDTHIQTMTGPRKTFLDNLPEAFYLSLSQFLNSLAGIGANWPVLGVFNKCFGFGGQSNAFLWAGRYFLLMVMASSVMMLM